MGQDTQRKYRIIANVLAMHLLAFAVLDISFNLSFGFFIEDLPSNIVFEETE